MLNPSRIGLGSSPGDKPTISPQCNGPNHPAIIPCLLEEMDGQLESLLVEFQQVQDRLAVILRPSESETAASAPPGCPSAPMSPIEIRLSNQIKTIQIVRERMSRMFTDICRSI